jgi:hypothetical protein
MLTGVTDVSRTSILRTGKGTNPEVTAVTDTDSMYHSPEAAKKLLPVFEQTEDGDILVCPHGHVHLAIAGHQITLTPEQAEMWIEVMYDAAQEAREVDDP